MLYAWRIGIDTPDYTADNMTGEGAKCTGGRWNRKGTAMLYASSSIALACLETLVHINSFSLPLNRYLVRIDIPAEVYKCRQIINAKDLEIGWDAVPEGKISIDVGQQWIASMASAVLQVPSVIVPEELNVLLNPAHPDCSKITASKIRRYQYDPRLNF
ncbi:MAG: RES family NAD+ phosphorylase [Deltaproteobacteria bacterium]|nr:RES family NAD+ phosphorylase [Deltaproteobacteria bacterium]